MQQSNGQPSAKFHERTISLLSDLSRAKSATPKWISGGQDGRSEDVLVRPLSASGRRTSGRSFVGHGLGLGDLRVDKPKIEKKLGNSALPGWVTNAVNVSRKTGQFEPGATRASVLQRPHSASAKRPGSAKIVRPWNLIGEKASHEKNKRGATTLSQRRPSSARAVVNESSSQMRDKRFLEQHLGKHRFAARPSDAEQGTLAGTRAGNSSQPPLHGNSLAGPSDGIVVTDANGATIVYRTKAARSADLERLNLDNRNLNSIPIFEQENSLRLLNFQHNVITQINTNLAGMENLVFLDLYDNKLTKIANLSPLVNLRVLMLGKNSIQKLSGLDQLTRLDVLDMHRNKLSQIEGLDKLLALRVLNLATNKLVKVENLETLSSLSELNLRRNRIRSISGLSNLVKLRHLFLSDNRLQSLEALNEVFQCADVVELTLDGNEGLAKATSKDVTSYRRAVVKQMKKLHVLDLVEITQEEREKYTASGQQHHLSTARSLTIDNNSSGRQKGRSQLPDTSLSRSSEINHRHPASHCSLQRWVLSKSGNEPKARPKQNTSQGTPPKFVERQDGTRELVISGDAYAILSSPAARKNLSAVSFNRSSVKGLVNEALPLLHSMSKTGELTFTNPGIHSLGDLAQVAKAIPLHAALVRFKFSLITELELYRPWFVYHCSQALMLDGVLITDGERIAAKKLFGPLDLDSTGALVTTESYVSSDWALASRNVCQNLIDKAKRAAQAEAEANEKFESLIAQGVQQSVDDVQ